MSNPMVELTNLVDRWYSRWGNAIASLRVGQYPPSRFGADVADTWVDACIASTLPWIGYDQIDVTIRPALPSLQFLVPPPKADMTQFVVVQPAAGDLAAAVVLMDPTGPLGVAFPAGNVVLTLAGMYLVASLINLAAIPPPPAVPANVYSGAVLGQPSNTPIAQMQVVWPG